MATLACGPASRCPKESAGNVGHLRLGLPVCLPANAFLGRRWQEHVHGRLKGGVGVGGQECQITWVNEAGREDGGWDFLLPWNAE